MDGPQSARRVVVTTSWDDGHRLDDRLAALLAKYGVPGTFYVSPRNVELAQRDRLPVAGIRELAERFEVGGHTLSHQRLPLLSDTAAREEIQAGKDELEGLIGIPVTSFCYPRGEYTPAHVQMVKEAGFGYARTVRRGSLHLGTPLESPTTVNAYAHRVDGPVSLRLARWRPHTAIKLYLAWDELALRWFQICLRDGGVFHLWGHSWEVDARRDWRRLERVLEYISGRPGVTYASNHDLIGLRGAR